MSLSHLDQGIYESSCLRDGATYTKERAIIVCDKSGNIVELKTSSLQFENDQCNEVVTEQIVVSSISLLTGAIGIKM